MSVNDGFWFPSRADAADNYIKPDAPIFTLNLRDGRQVSCE